MSTRIELGSLGTTGLEVDGRLVASEALAASGGFSVRSNADAPNSANRIINLALALSWRPSDGWQLQPFYSVSRNWEDVDPTIFISGFHLPPAISSDYFGQPWADLDRLQQTYGALARVDVAGGLAVQAGGFRSELKRYRDYSDLYRNTTPQGIADHVIVANSDQLRASTSGELRVTGSIAEAARAHFFHVLLRGRQARSLYGGSSSVSLGKARIGEYRPAAPPAFAFGPRSEDDVTQLTGGLGYEGRWPGVLEISIGVQKSRYEKLVTRPGSTPSSVTSSPWLYNGTAAIHLSQRLAVYGGYTKGMEENGTAPDVAANRGEPLPAALTSQREFGFRYAITPSFRLVAGVFDLRKPYFSLDASNRYGELGALRTRGIELSAAGPLATGLSVVAGAVLMDPRVTGEAVALGGIGERPVGQLQHLVKLSADYELPFWAEGSIDAGVEHTGPVAASVRPSLITGQQLSAPARTELELGARYRFTVGRAPAVLRLQIENVTNAGGWEVTGSAGFRRVSPRRAHVQVTLDY